MAEEIGFREALESVLAPLTTARTLLSVLERAERQGVLRALRDGATISDLAARTGQPEASVRALCTALVVNGVAEPNPVGFGLTRSWQALAAEGAFAPLSDILAQSRVIDRMVSTPDATYASIGREDRSAFAHAVSPDPFAADLVDRIRHDIEGDPWWAAMTTGGRYLELGCGIAGRMLTMVRAMPNLYATGVELDPDLAQQARRRANDLGLQGRVEIVTADATTYRSDEQFDFGFWSQWFFPASTREAALASMLANVRRGGVVRSPVFGDHERMRQDPVGSEARLYALNRVMLDAWGVPERTPEQLRSEFEDAGFSDVTIVPTDLTVSVYARRP